MFNSITSERNDLETKHEEPGTIIVQQVLVCADQTANHGITDVFVLLLYYYLKVGLENVVTMESVIKGRVVMDMLGPLRSMNI